MGILHLNEKYLSSILMKKTTAPGFSYLSEVDWDGSTRYVFISKELMDELCPDRLATSNDLDSPFSFGPFLLVALITIDSGTYCQLLTDDQIGLSYICSIEGSNIFWTEKGKDKWKKN